MSTDRKTRLQNFVDWAAAHITGDEKGEAQIFLDRLLQAFHQKGLLEIGKAEFRIRKAKEDGGGTAFADFVWKPLVLIEMKKRGTDLARHYRQAFDYWTRLVPGRPNYVVLSNFDEFWVYDFDVQLEEPMDRVGIEELPERYGPLAFLFPTEEKPVFKNNQEEVTRDAASRLAVLFNKLERRKDIERETAQRFVLQCLIALFSEDIGLLEPYTFTRLIEECDSPQKAYDLIGGLFVEMNTPGKTAGGRFKGVDYFNGGIFERPARVELHKDELAQLKKAAEQQWSKVRPEIFGTIFQHSVDKDERHAYGAHFTSAVDIMKIIKPTITDPWETLINRARSLAELEALHERMQHYRVLDPACGSGNFLYLAYRELKRLEKKLFDRMDELAPTGKRKSRRLSFVTARQFYGMDIIPFAVELAKVTMMIARKLSIEELHMDEPALPFDDLDENFNAGDSLITFPENGGQPFKTPWPDADVIIGNPPFLDARKTTIERGPGYVSVLESLYPEITRRSDYCVYWFRRAQENLPVCTPDNPIAGRAGLVGTQNIRNNESREGGLDYIVKSGTVVEAVDNQPWSGEANVHVSIANWVKHDPIADHFTDRERELIAAKLLIPSKRKLWFKTMPPAGQKRKRKPGQGSAAKVYELDFQEATVINSALSDEISVANARVLQANRRPKRCFEGQQPGHKGFRIDKSTFAKLIKANPESNSVLFPYLIGTSLLTQRFNTRPEYIADFGQQDLLEAAHHKEVLDLVRERVLEKWTANAKKEKKVTGKSKGEHQRRLETWWQLKRGRGDLINGIARLRRYIACSRVTKRPIFQFISSMFRPDSSLTAFTLDDDYSFGILQSDTHWQWFVAKCSKLTERFRYTPESVFDTFPWPQSPNVRDVKAAAVAGREVRRIRDEALTRIKGGLRAVYRTLELPGHNPLKDAHLALDEAVLAAYGFSAKKDLLQQLLDLNLDVAQRIERGERVTAPGIPPDFPNPESLITGDCIHPTV
jgi:hypothetical protein